MIRIKEDAPVKPVKKDKPRKGAGISQQRPDRPEAPAPAVAQKKPTAVPLVKKGPGRPAGPERAALLVRVPPELIGRLERTRAKRNLATRNEAIVALLDEGAEK